MVHSGCAVRCDAGVFATVTRRELLEHQDAEELRDAFFDLAGKYETLQFPAFDSAAARAVSFLICAEKGATRWACYTGSLVIIGIYDNSVNVSDLLSADLFQHEKLSRRESEQRTRKEDGSFSPSFSQEKSIGRSPEVTLQVT